MATKVQFTIGKLDAGMFPSILLPKGVTSGSLIDLAVSRNIEDEAKEQQDFQALQDDILKTFGTESPVAPTLSVRNTTQTSVVLDWDTCDTKTTKLKSLALYKNGLHLGKIPDPTNLHTTKISNLALDMDYKFHLVMETTGGTFTSNTVDVRTLKMTDLRGMRVCVGNIKENEKEALKQVVERIGCGPVHDTIRKETTHFVCSSLEKSGNAEEDAQLEEAQRSSIPIVGVDYFLACEDSGRVMNVSPFYVGNPNRPSQRIASASTPKTRLAQPAEEPADSVTPNQAAPEVSQADTTPTEIPAERDPGSSDSRDKNASTTAIADDEQKQGSAAQRSSNEEPESPEVSAPGKVSAEQTSEPTDPASAEPKKVDEDTKSDTAATRPDSPKVETAEPTQEEVEQQPRDLTAGQVQSKSEPASEQHEKDDTESTNVSDTRGEDTATEAPDTSATDVPAPAPDANESTEAAESSKADGEGSFTKVDL